MKYKFTIDRKTWLRGENENKSCLLRADGKMCCLGQISEQCEIQKSDLRGAMTIKDLNYKIDWPENSYLQNFISKNLHGLTINSEIALTLMETNDSTHLNDLEREKELTKLFATLDTEITFIN